MRHSGMTAVEQIQNDRTKAAVYRRQIGALSALGIIDFIPISLYQLGIIKSLPDFRSKIFDSDYVNASKEAQVLGQPDGPISLLMYATNLIAAGAAIKKKKRRNVFDYVIAANAMGQAAAGAYYLYVMTAKQKRICLYCMTGALVNFAALVPLAKLFKKT